MFLYRLAEASRHLGETRSRLQKIERLAEVLAKLRGREVSLGVAYLSGVLPQGRLGVGPAMLNNLPEVEAARVPELHVSDLDRALDELAAANGVGVGAERRRLLSELLARLTAEEQVFLRRLLLGELRHGAQEGIMLEAIAKAARVRPAELRRAAMFANDLGRVAAVAIEHGSAGLTNFRLEVFRPVLPMLAQPAHDVEEALLTLGGEAAFEYKLDGARIQAHRLEDEVRVYSREGHDVTARLPDVVQLVRGLPAEAIVLDGEVLALDERSRPRPFQTTMRRFGRQQDVEELARTLPLTPFFFDCLHKEGRDLVDLPAAERWAELVASIPATASVPRRVTRMTEQADEFFSESLTIGNEGIMAKSLTAPYAMGRRGADWLKLKPAHTLDLVVLAAEWGSGRREAWLSNLHLGARDEQGGFAMVGKTFKGMTDAMLEWQTRWFLEHELARDGATVYVTPDLVVEVAFDAVQASPRYPSGVALRFARVKRYRQDKRAAEAETLATVRAILAHEIAATRPIAGRRSAEGLG